MELPDPHMTEQPYHTAFWDLKTALQSTVDAPVIKRLLKWGVRVKEDDVMAATKIVADYQVDLYESILACSTHREDIAPTIIDLACLEALGTGKNNFVVALIKRGASPHPEYLYDLYNLDLVLDEEDQEVGYGDYIVGNHVMCPHHSA